MTSKTDFFPENEFPNGVSFDFPDHMVRLNNYRSTLMVDNIMRARFTGEMVPPKFIMERLASEFDLTVEQVYDFTMVGNWVQYDRELHAMSDSEREAHYEEVTAPVSEEDIATLRELGVPTIDEIIEDIKEQTAMRELEIQALNDLLNDDN